MARRAGRHDSRTPTRAPCYHRGLFRCRRRPPMDDLDRALRDPGTYPHDVGSVQVLETHISHVYLAGEFAYKVKKPVDLGFLDYSTVERRRTFCFEEVRLNRRLAPELYLGVRGLHRTPDGIRLGEPEDAAEYAVQMRCFRQEDQLDRCLAHGRLLL